MSTERTDIYIRITTQIVAAIEAGASSWKMPWHHDGTAITRPINVATGKRYRGSNILSLWIAAQAAGYGSGLWGSYRQWQAAGAQVRKGEHATTIVFWKISSSADDDASDDKAGIEHTRMFARGYSVFNQAQVEGYSAPDVPLLSEQERNAHAEAFYANLGIDTVYGGSEAYYVPSQDQVCMPRFALFKDVASHYSTLYHEGLHATGAPQRCGRDLSGRFGSEAYSMEEIIADLGSAMLMADLGIAHHPRPDHAAYIASWLKVLKNDKRAIFTAASKAQAAADWMHAQQPAQQLSAAA